LICINPSADDLVFFLVCSKGDCEYVHANPVGCARFVANVISIKTLSLLCTAGASSDPSGPILLLAAIESTFFNRRFRSSHSLQKMTYMHKKQYVNSTTGSETDANIKLHEIFSRVGFTAESEASLFTKSDVLKRNTRSTHPGYIWRMSRRLANGKSNAAKD
jgi:hypothetical protein